MEAPTLVVEVVVVATTGRRKGGEGGSGILIVRYQIGTLETSDAKASGGNISFYNGKTIHTFTNSGTFANPTALNGGESNPLTVEMIVIGGGGGGGWDRAGGGGAGSFVHATDMPIASGSSHPVVIGGGGLGGHPGSSGQTGNSGGFQGTPSTYNSTTIIANGGGAGGSTSGSPTAGAAGGNGGWWRWCCSRTIKCWWNRNCSTNQTRSIND